MPHHIPFHTRGVHAQPLAQRGPPSQSQLPKTLLLVSRLIADGDMGRGNGSSSEDEVDMKDRDPNFLNPDVQVSGSGEHYQFGEILWKTNGSKGCYDVCVRGSSTNFPCFSFRKLQI